MEGDTPPVWDPLLLRPSRWGDGTGVTGGQTRGTRGGSEGEAVPEQERAFQQQPAREARACLRAPGRAVNKGADFSTNEEC